MATAASAARRELWASELMPEAAWVQWLPHDVKRLKISSLQEKS